MLNMTDHIMSEAKWQAAFHADTDCNSVGTCAQYTPVELPSQLQDT